MSRLLPLMRWWAVDPTDPAFDALEATVAAGGFAADLDDLYVTLGKATAVELAEIERAVLAAFAADGGWRRYPDLWVRERLGEWPLSKQAEIMRAVATHRKVAVHSAHGVGKDFTASRLVAWWLTVFEHSMALTTAPSWAQVRSILWREIRAAHRKGNLAGYCNQAEWVAANGDVIGMGRKPANTDEHGFQGIHEERVLVVLDEAGGVPEGLFEDAEKLVTTPESRILAIGNPTHEGTYWHQVCSGAVPDWHVIHVSAFDTPNFGDEADVTPDEVLRRVTSKLWVEEQQRKWGEQYATHPSYVQQILGRFTREQAMTVVPLSWAMAAVSGEVPSTSEGVVRLGVDVGATGGDWFVIRAMAGNRVGKVWRDATGSAAGQADLVVRAAAEVGATEVCLDVAGVGYGLPALIHDRAPSLRVFPVDAAEKSSVVRLPDGRTCYRWAIPSGVRPEQVREQFANRRAELWWAARERCHLAVDPTYRPIVPYAAEPWDLSALDDSDLSDIWLGAGEDDPTLTELTTPGYRDDVPRGAGVVTQVESKDELRKASRLGRSTDFADSLLLAQFPHPGREVLPITASSAQRRARRPEFKPGSYRPARR